MRLYQLCNVLVSLAVVRALRISLLLTIIITGCATPPAIITFPICHIQDEPELKRDKIFENIALEILTFKKRTIAIIDFPNKDSEKIKKGEHVAEDMAVFLNQRIGREKVWIESGKNLMNILEKHRIIENGTIVDKERAKRLWQKMGIEVVITGALDPHPNGMGYLIKLHNVQSGKMISSFIGMWQRKDAITTKGGPSPESTGTSFGTWRPPIPTDFEEISQHFLNSHEHATLGDVGKALQTALKNAGFKTAYHEVPEGFALVSAGYDFRLSLDGTPILPNATTSSNALNLLKALRKDPWKTFFKISIFPPTEQQFYQVVCVIVTSGDVWEQRQMKFKEAQNLIHLGKATIPLKLKNQEYNEEKHVCMALLYAFEKDPSGDEIRFVPKGFRIINHLEKIGFWNNP